jgi:hypothetical protein
VIIPIMFLGRLMHTVYTVYGVLSCSVCIVVRNLEVAAFADKD